MISPSLAIKVDVDTERGTKIGVPNLLDLFSEFDIQATFLFSLGPDNTGRALKRIFRPGFLSKVRRTSVISTYGIRTLLNGVLLPGPHIGRRHENILRQVRDQQHEVGIHCYDHIRWQDGLATMTQDEVNKEFSKAQQEFQRIFTTPAKTAGAAGWQANDFSLTTYDAANLRYASDTRGQYPFFPRVGQKVFKTLQIPTTLPTLDELLGLPEYPEQNLPTYYLSLLQNEFPSVLTIHAELEGMAKIELFREFLLQAKKRLVTFRLMGEIAEELLILPSQIPHCELISSSVPGRAGTLAVQASSL